MLKLSALSGGLLAAGLALAPLPASAVPGGVGAVAPAPSTIDRAQIVNGRDYTRSPYVGRPVAPAPRFGGGPRFRDRPTFRQERYGRGYGYGPPRYYRRRDYY